MILLSTIDIGMNAWANIVLTMNITMNTNTDVDIELKTSNCNTITNGFLILWFYKWTRICKALMINGSSTTKHMIHENRNWSVS